MLRCRHGLQPHGQRQYRADPGIVGAGYGIARTRQPRRGHGKRRAGRGEHVTSGYGTDKGSITVYNRTASGNSAAIRTLSGPTTGLSYATGVFVNTVHDELVVASTDGSIPYNAITVYSRTASGRHPPIRTLSGPLTELSDVKGLVVDTVNDELVVSGTYGESVWVFARTASGDTAPLRTLSGAATGLDEPFSLVVDTVHDELLVANSARMDGNSSVTVYSRTANGDTAPLRTLSGAATGLSVPFGLAVDTVNNELVVGNWTNSITIYDRTASGNTAPIRTLSGPATSLVTPWAVAVTAAPDSDSDGVLDSLDNCRLVANADQRDTDADGIGNACDADLNNDCSVNFIDLGLLKGVFFGTDPDADFNGDGSVNFLDLGIMKSAFFQPPGPSGVPNVCDGH